MTMSREGKRERRKRETEHNHGLGLILDRDGFTDINTYAEERESDCLGKGGIRRRQSDKCSFLCAYLCYFRSC